MFFVLNKEKISAYVVSILTVCFLFFIASNATKTEIENTTATSVNIENVNTNNSNTNVNNTQNVGNNIQKNNSNTN